MLAGCVDLTERSTSAPAPSSPRGQTSTFAREGQVYCLRGWLGVWSHGIDAIARRATTELGVQASSFGNPEWRKVARKILEERAAGRERGPLVLVGHSIGGDDQIRTATLLNDRGIAVDLMILIDANTPPTVPPNVRRCVNIYKSQPGRDALPVFRGVRVRALDPSRTQVENIDLRTKDLGLETTQISHFNITDVKPLQDIALAEIAIVCPRRRRG